MTRGDPDEDPTVADVTLRVGEVRPVRRIADLSDARPRSGYARRVEDLDQLVEQWLTLPDVAEQLGIDVGKVRRLVQERYLIAVRHGDPKVLSVPEALLKDAQPLPELRGTLFVLADAGYGDESALQWLFTPDDSLPGTPVDALRAGRKTEIRRRAQALAF